MYSIKNVCFLFILFFVFGSCNTSDDDQMRDLEDLEGFFSEKQLQKIIYNDYRNTVWILASALSDDPSKGFLCGPGAFDYFLVKIEGEKVEVSDKIPMILEWTICQKNNLWVLSENQVKQIIDMEKPMSVFTEEEGFYLSSLVADSQGNLWASGSNGVLKMDENLNWTRYTPENSLVPSINTMQLKIGAEDTKWVSFDDGNLSLLKINDENWEHYICENDGPYCQSSNMLGVNKNGELLLSFYRNDIAAITTFNGTNYSDLEVVDESGNVIPGRVQKLKLHNGVIYAHVYNHQSTTSGIYKYENGTWTQLHTAKYLNDFALVENEIWLLDVDEGLVKIGM